MINQKVLSISFITSSLWLGVSSLTLVAVAGNDKVGPISLGISFLLTALSAYLGYKKGRPMSLLKGYLGVGIFIALGLWMIWFIENVRDLDLPKKVFLIISGGLLALNLSALGLTWFYRIQKHA